MEGGLGISAAINERVGLFRADVNFQLAFLSKARKGSGQDKQNYRSS
jgi:hypothetical protein